jgi:hypothetical protein
LQRPSPLPLLPLLSLLSRCPRRSPSFLFHPHRLLSALYTPSISKIMTPVLDRIETAADSIKHDEFLADKKRVMSFFFLVSLTLFHPMTLLTYATGHSVRIVQTRQSPARWIVLSFQETFSFTLPFSQCFRCIYFAFPVPSCSCSFS